MVALPTQITAGCPVCDVPLDLPVKTSPGRREGGHFVVGLGVDMDPVKSHFRAAHPELLAAAAADTGAAPAAASTGGVTITFHRPSAPDDTAALTRAARAAALHLRAGRR